MGRIKLKHLIITLKRNHVLVSKNSFWRGNYTLPIFAIMISDNQHFLRFSEKEITTHLKLGTAVII